MSSFVGSVAYVKYSKGETKGASTRGDTVNDPWHLGQNMDEYYTSEQIVTERVEEVAGGTGVEFMWQPVNIDTDTAGLHTNIIVKDTAGNLLVEGVNYSIDDSDPLHVKLTNGGVAYIYNVGYKYDNVIIAQEKLPTLVAEMDNIPLAARARRIAIRYRLTVA